MLCQRCKKQDATIHLTEIIPESDEKREKHLCESCAQAEGVSINPPPMPINELLSNFVTNKAGIQKLAELQCENCGISFVEFRHQGLLGCPEDYDVFGKTLQVLISRAHEGATHHVGKRPGQKDRDDTKHRKQQQIVRLQRSLDAAVKREDYESAAKMRDQLKTLQGKIS